MTIKHGPIRRRSRAIAAAAACLTLAFIAVPSPAHAQDARARVHAALGEQVGESFPGRAEATRTFGPGLTSLTVGGTQFTGFELSYPDIWNTDTSGARWCVYVNCLLLAPVQLPSGALITQIELNAYDASTVKDVRIVLQALPSSGGPPLTLATVGSSSFIGYSFYTVTLVPPHTVDNGNNTYVLLYDSLVASPNPNNPLDDTLTRVQAVRIYYRLQTSPPPAVATFGDVPVSHPFFPSVEAMVAAGITAGCGSGNFCPDGLVTRAQMAAFFSRALGLHFAP